MKINSYFSFNSKLQGALCLLGLFFVGQNSMTMDLPIPSDTIFVYEEGSSNFIPVKKEVYMLSEYIKSVVFGGAEIGLEEGDRTINLDFSFGAIKSSFYLMEIYARHKKKREDIDVEGLEMKGLEKAIHKYEFGSLISIANCIDYLLCPPLIKKICLRRIKELADKSGKNLFNDPYFGMHLQELSLPLQESLFLYPSVSNLKKLIINSAKNRNVFLEKNKGITSYFKAEVYNVEHLDTKIVWSLDETKICISAPGQEFNEVNLWNVADQNNITHQLLLQNNSASIAFSPDGKKIAIDNSSDYAIDIWDIDLGRFINRFHNNQGSVSKNVFSQDGTKLFSTTYQGGVISSFSIKDMIDGTSKEIYHDFHYLGLPVMSHDGTIIAMIAVTGRDFFIALFNITDLSNITLLKQIPFQMPLESIAFSPNDRKIACTLRGRGYTLSLLDISNLSKVSHKYLAVTHISRIGHFETVTFTPDGENIIAAGESKKKDPILVLWDVQADFDEYPFFDLGFGRAVAAAPSLAQGCRIVFLDNLPIIQTLFTQQEMIAFNELKQCNIDQIRLVYALSLRLLNDLENEIESKEKRLRECTNSLEKTFVVCREVIMSSKKEIELDSDELSVFEQLPQNLRQVLEQVLNIRKKSEGSSWW